MEGGGGLYGGGGDGLFLDKWKGEGINRGGGDFCE